MAPAVQAIRPAQQRRSRETLTRIVEALEAALEASAFEDVSVQMICQRAGCSVGTFYGRVGNKEALLEHLRERVYSEMRAYLDQLVQPERWAGVPLADLLRAQTKELVQLHRTRSGVIRAVILQARRSPAFAESAIAFNDFLLTLFSKAWLSRREEIGHERPARAVEQAFLMAAGFLRERIIFGELWRASVHLEDDELAIELADALNGYLRTENKR